MSDAQGSAKGLSRDRHPRNAEHKHSDLLHTTNDTGQDGYHCVSRFYFLLTHPPVDEAAAAAKPHSKQNLRHVRFLVPVDKSKSAFSCCASLAMSTPSLYSLIAKPLCVRRRGSVLARGLSSPGRIDTRCLEVPGGVSPQIHWTARDTRSPQVIQVRAG